MLGFGMIAVFGFLTFRNVRSRRYFWCVVSGLGLLLGLASVWVEYDKRTNPRALAAARSSDDRSSGNRSSGNPWSKES